MSDMQSRRFVAYTDYALLGLVPDLDAAQQIALASAGQFVQKDDLIALHGGALSESAISAPHALTTSRLSRTGRQKS